MLILNKKKFLYLKNVLNWATKDDSTAQKRKKQCCKNRKAQKKK